MTCASSATMSLTTAWQTLAEKYKTVKADRLSANYNFDGTELEGRVQALCDQESRRQKIGFIGLNINPESLISEHCIDVDFKEIIPTANDLAAYLKNKKNVTWS